MAPVKPVTQQQRDQAVARVLEFLISSRGPDPGVAEDVSEVKGLFTRSFKQDQWDWFTVWTQLGRPGRECCKSIANDLRELRRTLINKDLDRMQFWCKRLKRADAAAMLRTFLNSEADEHGGDDEVGYIYILSIRSNPRMLKIGYTERTVEQRVKEINRATGIVEPYGVRAVWTVLRAPHVEKAVHEALAEYRVRRDREFFELDYYIAFQIIGDFVRDSRHEL